jgi:hypothetical protein
MCRFPAFETGSADRTADACRRGLAEPELLPDNGGVLLSRDLADWPESPWTGPPPFLAGQVFRVEESVRDDRYVIRAELPSLDPENDIEVTVDGRILTIRAERH